MLIIWLIITNIAPKIGPTIAPELFFRVISLYFLPSMEPII